MRKTARRQFGFFNLRIVTGFVLCFFAIVFALFAIDSPPDQTGEPQIVTEVRPLIQRTPRQLNAVRAAGSFRGDLRILSYDNVVKADRMETEPPPFVPRL